MQGTAVTGFAQYSLIDFGRKSKATPPPPPPPPPYRYERGRARHDRGHHYGHYKSHRGECDR